MIEIASTSPDGPRVAASVALCSKNCGRFRGGRRWREHAWVPSGGCVHGWTRWEELYALGKYQNCPPDSESAEKWPEQKCRRRFPFDSGTQVGSQPGVSQLESWSRRLAAISYLHGWCDDRQFRYTVFQKNPMAHNACFMDAIREQPLARLGHRWWGRRKAKKRRSRFPYDSGARAGRLASSVSRFRDVAVSLGESDFFLFISIVRRRSCSLHPVPD
jgi:hypothetical protein